MTVVTHYETIGDCLPTCAGAQNSAFQIGFAHAVLFFNNSNLLICFKNVLVLYLSITHIKNQDVSTYSQLLNKFIKRYK